MITVRQEILAWQAEAVRLRRALHKIPEKGLQEYKTQQFLLNELAQTHPDKLETLAGTGIKAVYYAPNAERTVAFRADIDALALHEETGVPFASEHEGMMHACGHDGHMTALLLLAKLIDAHRAEQKHNLVLLFQPGEEFFGGAAYMVRDGALHDPEVDEIYGMHVCPELPIGTLSFCEGAAMARSVGLDITVHGVSAHGARPEEGKDAIVAAAQLILMLQTIISRNVAARDEAVLTIGSVHGGKMRNIVCDEVALLLTLRTYTDEVCDRILARIEEQLSGLETAFGVRCTMTKTQDYPAVYNAPHLVEHVRRIVENDVVTLPPRMISEDFSFYQKEVPGVFFHVGVSEGQEGLALHNSRFFYREEALLYGVEVFWRLATAE